jgi:multimeric flavodoxin WrbA
MMVLGLQGSPREKGNTAFLLSAFMSEAKKLGAQTYIIEVDKKKALRHILLKWTKKRLSLAKNILCVQKGDFVLLMTT